MNDLEPTPADGSLADGFHHGVSIREAVTYFGVTAQLAIAATAMFSLSRAARGAATYLEDCAQQVDALADTAAGLGVDATVTSAHHDAATVMRGVLVDAETLASEAADMASGFQAARDAHEADYGPVQEAMTTKTGDVADRTYYSNR